MIDNNKDLYYYLLSLMGAMLLGFLFCLGLVALLAYFGSSLEGGLKTTVASIIVLITEVIVIYKKLCTPTGEIASKLQSSETKKYDSETFNTIVDGG
jgi:ascorbate-specific PTS system EIIC-type component UlaA